MIEASEHAEDLQLLALLVAKRLRDDSCEGAAPAGADYAVVPSKRNYASGLEVQVRVSLGRGMNARVDDAWTTKDFRDLNDLQRSSNSIAEKVAGILRQASELRVALSEVRTAAKREILKANRRGLPYELTSVAFTPVEALRQDEPIVRVEHTALGKSLLSEVFEFEAMCAKDVHEAFKRMRETQTRRVEDCA